MDRVLDAVVAMAPDSGALCTIVETRGSVPAPAGARMLVRADGTFAGTVGGGCLEHDVWAVARRVLDDGESRVVAIDLTDYEAQEAGLACGGSLRVLVEPVTEALIRSVRTACEVAADGEPVVLYHRAPDSDAPHTPCSGAAHPEWAEGPLASTPIAGALVGAARQASERAEGGVATLVVGGEGVRVFIQPLTAPELIILGGGHVGRALDAAARPCGWRTIVVDDRADFANAERFPEARTVVAPFREAFGHVATGPSTAICVVTRGHQFDAEGLAAACRTEAGYIGLIGSARKILTVYERCIEWGVPAERLAEVFAPIGVGIGAQTPAEIATAVVAELVAVRRLGPDAALARNPKAAAVRERFAAWLAKRADS